jgi:hypothetical protein
MLRCSRSVFLLVLVLGCISCAGIKIKPVYDNKPVTGTPWNLPMTQFNLTITRSVTECGEHMNAGVEVVATSASVIDEGQRYVLNSKGWLATSDITSSLAANGVSTGLNAQSTDQTGTIISNVVATFGKIVVGAASVAALKPVLSPQGRQVCSSEVLDAVNKLYPAQGKKLKEKVDDETAALASATAEVAVSTALAQADQVYKNRLAEAIQKQNEARKKLEEDQKELTKNLKITSDTQVVSWPLKADEVRKDTPYAISEALFEKWTGLKGGGGEKEKELFHKAYEEVNRQVGVYLALYKQEPSGSWKAPDSASLEKPVDVKTGVPVRLAQIGRLLICLTKSCPDSIPVEGINEKTIKQSDQVVLQLGQMYIVPVAGGIFRSETGVIALDTNGLPTSIRVARTAAAGANLTATAKDVATQLAALPADVRAAELARIKAQTDQLNAQSALKTAQANLSVADQTSSLAAQTALIDAQTGLATAQINAGFPLATAALKAQADYYNAQTGLTSAASAQISAQTALLNAQVALANAQANAAVIDQTSVLAAQATLLNAQTALINAAAALAKAEALRTARID